LLRIQPLEFTLAHRFRPTTKPVSGTLLRGTFRAND
jgi:hypothetical protein